MNLRSMRGTLVIALSVAVFYIPSVLGKAAATQELTGSQRPSASSPAAPAAIPVAEVATRATEVSKFLQTLGSQVLVPSPEVNKIGRQLPELSDRMGLEYAATAHILEGPSTLEALQTQQQLWERLRLQTSGWLSLLTTRATQLQEALDRLAGLRETWTKTRDAAVAASAPGQILQAIQATLKEIEAAQPALQAQNAVVLDLQSRIAQEVARCGKALSGIVQAQQREMGGILTRDGPPIWSAELWDTSLATILAGIHRSASLFTANIRTYFHPTSTGLLVQVGLFAALALLFCTARRQVVHWSEAGEEKSPYISVFDHPYAAAILVPLLVGSAPTWQAPTMVRHMFTALALLPMIRLTQQGARSNSIRGPYVLGILFTLDAVRQAFAGAPLLEQGILLLEALSGMVLVGWLLASGHLRRLHEEGIGMLRLQKLRALGWLVLLTLSGGLAGGVFGYLRFARLLLSGLWAGGVLALVLYCLLRVLSGLVAFSLHVRPLRRLRMVQSHRGFLEHRTHRVLAWAAICAWVYPREQGAYQARGRHHRAQRPTGHGASDNWTLSDRMRRLELPVGINYGAAPQKVIEVLEKVALKHPHVLHHPPPQALLTAYGDSSINFELRVWTDELDDWAKIRSDLAVALYDAIQEAGMQFPFPQREVRLLQDSPENAAKVT